MFMCTHPLTYRQPLHTLDFSIIPPILYETHGQIEKQFGTQMPFEPLECHQNIVITVNC